MPEYRLGVPEWIMERARKISGQRRPSTLLIDILANYFLNLAEQGSNSSDDAIEDSSRREEIEGYAESFITVWEVKRRHFYRYKQGKEVAVGANKDGLVDGLLRLIDAKSVSVDQILSGACDSSIQSALSHLSFKTSGRPSADQTSGYIFRNVKARKSTEE